MKTIEQKTAERGMKRLWKEKFVEQFKIVSVIIPLVFAFILTSIFWAVIAIFALLLTEKY